eukprot:CAMPEP_0185186960 /NCGR_PEP_ID=MMETSP1140-20130426/4409_1 /TAXON_ID=298111 /ORGANISM="Pavlova sp., Strain CCMP459" /LENGTH=111 /DNA_ID=CAMNT_0027753295 /DNA_START=78 /DNA_END=414 /DNA_ORIENTATION=-
MYAKSTVTGVKYSSPPWSNVLWCPLSNEQCPEPVTSGSVQSGPALGAATSRGTSTVLSGAPTPVHLRALALSHAVPGARPGGVIRSSYASTPTYRQAGRREWRLLVRHHTR